MKCSCIGRRCVPNPFQKEIFFLSSLSVFFFFVFLLLLIRKRVAVVVGACFCYCCCFQHFTFRQQRLDFLKLAFIVYVRKRDRYSASKNIVWYINRHRISHWFFKNHFENSSQLLSSKCFSHSLSIQCECTFRRFCWIDLFWNQKEKNKNIKEM